MTADDRLNQLEPLLAESMTILDRHTFQLKQLSNSVSDLQNSVSTLITASVRHSDDITFLLREQAEIKTDIAEIKTDVADIKTEQTSMNGKLDLLIQLLQKPGQ